MKRWCALIVVPLALMSAVRIAAQTAPGDMRPPSTMQQLMRSIFFVNANVVFSGQLEDPESLQRDRQSALSTNPLTGLYGGWQALENSGLALADAADLLNVRGRACSNGTLAPVDEADWKAAVLGLRDTGLAAAAAARARSQDRIVEVSERLTDACAACHRVYRNRQNLCVSSRR